MGRKLCSTASRTRVRREFAMTALATGLIRHSADLGGVLGSEPVLEGLTPVRPSLGLDNRSSSLD
jgi:hypothetical protein